MELPVAQVERFCDIDTKKCVIELSYASKIPLDSSQLLLGGNGANVAIGTKRLGVESLLVAELGEGILADYAKKILEGQIDTKYVTQTPGVSEGFGAVLVYQGERTILSYYPPGKPAFPLDLPQAEWAYLTSVGEDFEDYFEQVLLWLSKFPVKLVFNPGGRQIAKGRDWLRKYFEKCEIIFVNREEGEEIAGLVKTQGKEKELISALLRLGPRKVVVTDGTFGVFAGDGQKHYKAGILPIDAIERTGAGDAFSSGCLSALISGKSLSEGLFWGSLNSSSVIGYIGPQKGLLFEKDIPAWAERARSFGFKVEEF